MSFIKKLFGNEPKQRAVTKVQDLQLNDMISMSDSFGLPTLLRDQQFQVTAINCYEFEHKVQTEWVLSGQSDIELYLSLEVDDKTYLKFSLKNFSYLSIHPPFASFRSKFENEFLSCLKKMTALYNQFKILY